MGIILWIIFGGLVGWVTSFIITTHSQHGLILNIIIGIVGSVFGGWLMGFFGRNGVTGFTPYSFAVAILGATIFIIIVKIL
jgi:uncharacterized membrane protein YeaQ/YmgE (transglycosylase-associated protein family)